MDFSGGEDDGLSFLTCVRSHIRKTNKTKEGMKKDRLIFSRARKENKIWYDYTLKARLLFCRYKARKEKRYIGFSRFNKP